MSPQRTNPVYAQLAYRKAILGEVITFLTNTFTTAYNDEPAKTIVSEDVFREDSDVPLEDVGGYILELQQEEESLRLELAKFEFVKRGEDGKQIAQGAKGNGGNGTQGRKGRGKGPVRKG